jgi:hypothetical protein
MLGKLPGLGMGLAEISSALPVSFDPVSDEDVKEILVLIDPVSSVE